MRRSLRSPLVAVALAVVAIAGTTAAIVPPPQAAPIPIRVWKSPSCGCCKDWITHIEKAGFKATVEDVANVEPVKQRLGLPANLASCHTALVNGYVIEGHVPADLIQKLLREKPAVAGLAVPGMPMGSPGMEGGRKDPYDVVAFTRDGGTRVYAKR